jgi:hypothetical protein
VLHLTLHWRPSLGQELEAMVVFSLTRRRLLGWLSMLAVASGWRRVHAGVPVAYADAQGGPRLPPEMLLALGGAVLPSELGSAGIERAVRAFSNWIAGYRAEAELLHPYGSSELESSPPSPVATWRQQLSALDTSARGAHRRPFVALGIREQQALVRQALDGARLARLPAPIRAPHVAVALLAHFYESPDATDLCYGAEIRKNQCRPLVNSPREPLPLNRGRSG